MALISCPECGGKLSTLAAACPHCGLPSKTELGQQTNAANPHAIPPVAGSQDTGSTDSIDDEEGRVIGLIGVSVILLLCFFGWYFLIENTYRSCIDNAIDAPNVLAVAKEVAKCEAKYKNND